jgi:hypothetical protein
MLSNADQKSTKQTIEDVHVSSVHKHMCNGLPILKTHFQENTWLTFYTPSPLFVPIKTRC